MSVVPASSLSASDLHVLGNNVLAAVRHDRHEVLAAVNRSLAAHDESVPRLFAARPRAAACLRRRNGKEVKLHG